MSLALVKHSILFGRSYFEGLLFSTILQFMLIDWMWVVMIVIWLKLSAITFTLELSRIDFRFRNEFINFRNTVSKWDDVISTGNLPKDFNFLRRYSFFASYKILDASNNFPLSISLYFVTWTIYCFSLLGFMHIGYKYNSIFSAKLFAWEQ